MNAAPTRRTTAALAVGGALVALVGNAIAPRINGDDVDVYRKIAHSDRFAIAGLIILVAVVLVSAAFVGLSRRSPSTRTAELAQYARVAAVIGGALAVLQTAVELYAYRQEARAFDAAHPPNVVSAFWATNALDRINSAMFASWTIVLLGAAPVLLGALQLRSRSLGRLGYAAIVGGAVCAVVGVASLLTDDQSTYDIPFAIGSVIVTVWLLGTGISIWRHPEDASIDISDGSSVRAQKQVSAPG
jgi:uncharacterized membrane protein YidH (DUF202 family)